MSKNDRQGTDFSRSSSSSSPSTSSNSNSSVSVDNIVNEMTKSFSAFKSTRLYDFYDSSWSNVNWGRCGATAAAASVNPDSSSSSSSWLSSLDFLRTINLNAISENMKGASGSSGTSASSTRTATTGAGTGGDGNSNNSSLDLVYNRLGSLSNQLVYENRIVTALSKQITESFNRNLQLTSAGVFFGAALGAAISTGVIVGLMAATNAIANSEYLPIVYRKMLRFWNRKASEIKSKTNCDKKPKNDKDDNNKDPLHQNDDSTSSETSSSGTGSSSSRVSTGQNMVVVQANPSDSTLSSTALNSKDQCESCLQEVASNLASHGLTWKDVHRVTAYLVSGKCNGPTFREVLEQQLLTGNQNNGKPSTADSKPLISIVFVQQVEREDAMLQVEVIANTAAAVSKEEKQT